MVTLKLIGYWHSSSELEWPDPAWFVDPQWDAAIKEKVIAYLERGKIVAHFMGTSWCRFHCERYGEWSLGSTEQTDGVYIWPSGLAHYLDAHDVRLPDEFVNHVLRQPTPPEPDTQANEHEHANSRAFSEVDYDWWSGQKGFTQGRSFQDPLIVPQGFACAIVTPREPDDELLTFLNRHRFVPYWRLDKADLHDEIRKGATFQSKEIIKQKRFDELKAMAKAIGLTLKYSLGEDEPDND